LEREKIEKKKYENIRNTISVFKLSHPPIIPLDQIISWKYRFCATWYISWCCSE